MRFVAWSSCILTTKMVGKHQILLSSTHDNHTHESNSKGTPISDLNKLRSSVSSLLCSTCTDKQNLAVVVILTN